MKKIRSQTGITLIEVLATLTIMSLLMGIVYGVFVNGLNYSSKAKNTVSIQQEANYLLTLLKEQHENQKSYTITVSEDHQNVQITNSENTTFTLGQGDYLYEILKCEPDLSCTEQTASITINPATENFYVKIVLKNSKNPDVTFKVKTILSRL